MATQTQPARPSAAGVIAFVMLAALIYWAFNAFNAIGSMTTGAVAPTPVPASLGQPVQAGNWSMTLTRAETATALGSAYMRKRAQGLFLVLTMTGRNLHKETSTLNSFDFDVRAPDGTKYSISQDGTSALLADDPAPVLWVSQEFQPGLAKSFRLVFDVNPNVKTYVLDAAKIGFRLTLS